MGNCIHHSRLDSLSVASPLLSMQTEILFTDINQHKLNSISMSFKKNIHKWNCWNWMGGCGNSLWLRYALCTIHGQLCVAGEWYAIVPHLHSSTTEKLLEKSHNTKSQLLRSKNWFPTQSFSLLCLSALSISKTLCFFVYVPLSNFVDSNVYSMIRYIVYI